MEKCLVFLLDLKRGQIRHSRFEVQDWTFIPISVGIAGYSRQSRELVVAPGLPKIPRLASVPGPFCQLVPSSFLHF